MPTLPTNDELHKFREQANQAARTPLLAALGAGDFAAQTVLEALTKLREQVEEQTESARETDLRGKLDPTELRKRVDAYTQSAVQLYGYLADRGEDTLGRLQSQPRLKQARDQVGAAQDRVEVAVEEVRDLADDVLGKVTRSTRSVGEQAAEATEKASDQAAETVKTTAEDTAEKVQDAGGKTATATRSTTRKAANRTAEAKSGNQPKSGPRKSAES